MYTYLIAVVQGFSLLALCLTGFGSMFYLGKRSKARTGYSRDRATVIFVLLALGFVMSIRWAKYLILGAT